MKRQVSSSSDEYFPPDDTISQVSIKTTKQKVDGVMKNNTFWYYLRKFKQQMRVKFQTNYQNHYQSIYNRGFKEGKESKEVNKMMITKFDYGYALGIMNAMKGMTHEMPLQLESRIPRYVHSLYKETRRDVNNIKKEISQLKILLKQALDQGIFKVKKPRKKISVKYIYKLKKKGKRQVNQEVKEIQDEVMNFL
eukprot:TRINITY_DN15967_c0_g1_i1.p1 TRINITY_DN15967_c0_g1~~TRINITY_DN15967_c0_g1_i1.p1  ORF type:complete len:194 (+),score=39.66 TRINITY_DN15967_c0_g1_i1:54-635(+)